MQLNQVTAIPFTSTEVTPAAKNAYADTIELEN